MRLLLSALYAHATETPRRPALLFLKDGAYVQYSYADLLIETERWARRFAAAQLEAYGTIAIVADHRVDMYPAFLGALRAGYVPAFLAYPTPKQHASRYWEAQRELFARVRPVAIVTYAALAERVAELAREFGCATFDLDDRTDLDRTDPPAAIELPPLDSVEVGGRHVVLQHSSGTTGSKKGVALTFEAIRAQTVAHARALPASASDIIVSWLPLYHDMGLSTAFLFPITIGSCVVSFDAFEWLVRPALFFELIERFRATHAWLPNFALNHLVRTHDAEARYDLSSLRALVSSSEPCRAATFASFAATFEPHGFSPLALRCSYAMAETVFAATLTAPRTAPRCLSIDARELATHGTARTAASGGTDYLSCGRPLEGIELRIFSDGGTNVGEIGVRGTFVFDGYAGVGPAESGFEDGWFRTGDVGFFYDGELFVCGRIKEMLVVHGQNFYASDIEAIVDLVAGVKPGRSVAFGIFEEVTASEEAVVLAESDATGDVAHDEIARTIRERVFDVLGLRIRSVDIRPVGDLIKTTSGKMSRAENVRRFEASARP